MTEKFVPCSDCGHLAVYAPTVLGEDCWHCGWCGNDYFPPQPSAPLFDAKAASRPNKGQDRGVGRVSENEHQIGLPGASGDDEVF